MLRFRDWTKENRNIFLEGQSKKLSIKNEKKMFKLKLYEMKLYEKELRLYINPAFGNI